MKKTITLFMMCLALGTVCLTGCTANEEVFTQKTFLADTEEITDVRIDARDRQIEVTLSADSQIHIDYYENSKEYYEISTSQDNVLTMTSVSNKEWTDYIGGKTSKDNRKISVQIPDKLLSALQLSTTNETISLPSITVIGDISLSTNSGNLSFDSLDAGKSITLKAKNGKISGSIVGGYDDYSISCDVKKGESNLPTYKENGTKTLAVSNNNGDIDIQFVNE